MNRRPRREWRLEILLNRIKWTDERRYYWASAAIPPFFRLTDISTIAVVLLVAVADGDIAQPSAKSGVFCVRSKNSGGRYWALGVCCGGRQYVDGQTGLAGKTEDVVWPAAGGTFALSEYIFGDFL